MDCFDEAGDGEGGEHVACAGEEEGDIGGVDTEEAGLVVGRCGRADDRDVLDFLLVGGKL